MSYADDETVKRTVEAKERTTEIALVPDADHCIETVARSEYGRYVNACLRLDRFDPELGVRLEILQRFLEQADFRRLRRESEPFITAARPVRFVIGLDGKRARWRIQAETAKEEER